MIRSRDQIYRTRPVSVVRQRDWKLHLYHEEWALDGGRSRLDTSRAVELYNLAQDSGERVDLANANKAKRDELLDPMFGWIQASSARMAHEPNPNYDPGKPAK